MKNPNIAAAFGWAAYPDNQEGLFLQPEEETKLESLLATNAEAAKTGKQNATRITELEGLVEASNKKATTAEGALATANTRITELEGIVPPAAATGKTEDENPEAANAAKNKKYMTSYDQMFTGK